MRRVLLCVALIALLPGLWTIESVSAADAKKQQAAASQSTPSSLPAGYVGVETCAACHEDLVKGFAANPHTRLALTHGGNGVTCEDCHGPGQGHVDGGGDVTKIFQFDKATPKLVDQTCLGCHAAAHPNFERSPHGEAAVSCTSCHSVHKSGEEAHLLKAAQPTLCYGCHTDVKPAFAQPFHHKVDEGLMNCSDCHNPHGTFQDKQLKGTADQSAICTKCHIETAGPFVYEHPVVKTEGCTACHSPHGSPNPRLLNVSNVNMLCLQCHSQTNMSAFPHAVSPSGPTHNQATQYVACTNCHTQIHGSNADSVYFR